MSAGPKVVDAGRLQHGQYRVRASQSWAILVTRVKRFLDVFGKPNGPVLQSR